MTIEQLTQLNDKLADTLCMTSGFKMALKSFSTGNKEQNKALTEFCDIITKNLLESKRLIHNEISKPLTTIKQ